MAPKGRKSFTSNWYACDSCGVTLSQKDVQQHNVSCPPDGNDWQHPFIRNNTLFSFLEQSDVNDGPKVREHEKQFFVYLSQSAMQLCHLEIGEQVVLLKESQSVVRTVWPTSEKSLTSVTIPTLLPGMSQKFYEEGKKMRVTKLLTKPIPALSISLTTNDDISEEISEQLILVCKQLYGGKILKTGSDMFLPFCGKFITFKVDISYKMENDNTEDLVQNLENLNIKGDEEKYFVAVDTTEWKIFKKSDLNRDQLIKKIGLQDVGGYKEVTKELTDTISHALRNNNNQTYFSTSMGILLYGPNGVGKTYICEAVVNETNAHIIQINSGELFSKFFGETELRLRKLFEEAKSKSPSIIVLDNVDTLCSKRSGTEQERRVTAYLLTLIDSLKNHKTVVLATTSQLNHIDPALRRPGRLDCEIELPIPSAADRLAILKVLLARWSVDDADVTKVAQAAHGYVAADLQCLVTKAAMQASTQGKSQLEASHLYWALSQIKPSAMREVQVQVPNVKWTDIGGMDELKLKLQQSIEWPLRHPEAFARLGITPPRGVLMYGPPGCSKTMIAKALATESKLNFLSIKGSELFSKWVGESEKAVQAVFKKARAVAPSIIFLDELDALGGERGGGAAEGGSNVQERVLAQMLTEMDGVEPLGNVNIVAATNRPDRIDKALLRPGRLDRLIYVPLPDLATRICILQLQLIKMPVARDIVIDDLALKTEGYSGAEVIAVCHEAAINALQEDFNMNEIHIRHFAAALETVKPRTPESLLKLYDSYKK